MRETLQCLSLWAYITSCEHFLIPANVPATFSTSFFFTTKTIPLCLSTTLLLSIHRMMATEANSMS